MTAIDWTKPIEDCRPGYEGEEATLVQTCVSGLYPRIVRFSKGDMEALKEDGKEFSCSTSPSVRNRPDPPPVKHDFGFPYEILGDGGLSDEDRELARKLRADLYAAFTWKNTEDGHAFWSGVGRRLKRIATEGR